MRKHLTAVILLGLPPLLVAAPGREPEGLTWREPAPVMEETAPLPKGATARLGRYIVPSNFQAFSPDRKLFATTHIRQFQSGAQDRIHIWDAATGKHLRTLDGHSTGVMSVAFSPDGTVLASGGIDNAMRLWDVNTGKQLGETQAHEGHVYMLCFTPDGKQLVSASNEVRLWDAVNVKEVRKFPKPESKQFEFFFNAALSPDGKTLATGSEVALRLWSVADGKEIRTINERIAPHQQRLVFSADGKTVITNGPGQALRKWDVETGKPVNNAEPKQGATPEYARFAAGGKAVAFQERTNVNDFEPRVYVVRDTENGKEIARVTSPSPVLTFGLSADGKSLAAGGVDGALRLWDATTGKLSRTVLEAPQPVIGLYFADGGKTVVSLTGDGVRHDWTVEEKREKRQASLSLPEKPVGRRMSADGSAVALADKDGTLRVWDTATGKELWKAEKAIHVREIPQEGGFGPRGPGGPGLPVPPQGAPQGGLRPPPPPPFQPGPPILEPVFAFSADGKTLVGQAADGSEVIVWNAATGKKVGGCKLGKGETCSSVGGDGKRLFAALSGGALLVSNEAGDDWARRVALPAPEANQQFQQTATAVELLPSPDGKTLAIVQEIDSVNIAAPGLPGRPRPHSVTHRILLLELAGKEDPKPIPAAAGRTVVFSPDGKQVAFTEGAAVGVWDRTAGKLRRSEVRPESKGGPIAFSPDGKTLATGDESTILLWDVKQIPEATDAKK
jgi:WD40 repeat protein